MDKCENNSRFDIEIYYLLEFISATVKNFIEKGQKTGRSIMSYFLTFNLPHNIYLNLNFKKILKIY